MSQLNFDIKVHSLSITTAKITQNEERKTNNSRECEQ